MHDRQFDTVKQVGEVLVGTEIVEFSIESTEATSPIPIASTTRRFNALYRRLSRPQANALFNDCINELSAAWKFLTALRAEVTMLVVARGFSGIPLAFARHLCRVDVLGFNQQEADLFRELAQFKNLPNCRVCPTVEELQGPYGLILWLPTRSAVSTHDEQECLRQAIAHIHQQAEIWLALSNKPSWTQPLQRLKRAVHYLKSHNREPVSTSVRLLPLPEPMPSRPWLEELLARFAVEQNGWTGLARIDHFGVVSNWSAPAQIAPLGLTQTSPIKTDETGHAFKALERSKLSEAHYTLTRLRMHVIPPFISRLFKALEQEEPGSDIQPHHFHVLAGGKVQIDAVWKRRLGEQAFFVKLPLVPFAEARLRNQCELLSYLLGQEVRRRFESLPQPAHPQKIFPEIFGQGEFEKQAYFLESRLEGAPLSRLQVPRTVFPKICSTLFSFWLQVQACCGESVHIDRGKFQQLFQQPLSRLAEWAQPPQPYQDILLKLEDFFAGHFSEQRIYLGLVHGDFSPKNILANPKNFELSGIIDWDIAARQSIPLLDVLHFFVRLDPDSFRAVPPRIALRLIQSDTGALHWPYLRAAMTEFGYGNKTLPAVVAYYWLQRLHVYVDSQTNLDTHFMQRQFYETLDFFNNTILEK